MSEGSKKADNVADSFTDEVLFENEWVTLKVRRKPPHCDGYVFTHLARCGGTIVSVLPFRRRKSGVVEYLLREEVTPCWGFKPTLSSVTGGCEPGRPPQETAVEELREETGYDVPWGPERWAPLGLCRMGKESDTWVHLFAVDVTGLEPGEVLGDGSYYDANAPSIWAEDPWESDDPLSAVAWARFRNLPPFRQLPTRIGGSA